MQLTGFTLDEIDNYRDLDAIAEPNDEETILEVETAQPVTRLGDIWQIGVHRLICGDATDPATFQKFLGRERPDMILGDTAAHRASISSSQGARETQTGVLKGRGHCHRRSARLCARP